MQLETYGFESIEVNALHEYIDRIQDLFENTVLYRGQATKLNLIPAIARNKPSHNIAEIENKRIKQLQLLGASHSEIASPSMIDLLVAAQHHGMKTRLLDWSSSALVALWFACSDRTKGDTYVYSLNLDPVSFSVASQNDDVSLGALFDRQNEIEPRETFVLQPKSTNKRVQAQNGWFTYHRYSKGSNSFVSLEHNPKFGKNLKEYRFPSERRARILHELARLGISQMTLFPDLDGLCQHINTIT